MAFRNNLMRLTYARESASYWNWELVRTGAGLDILHFRSTYTYDTASSRATMSDLGQPTINYSYDSACCLMTISQGSTMVMLGYDDANRHISLTLRNGVQVIYGYDIASRITSID
jgi:YD repeat-containing protein